MLEEGWNRPAYICDGEGADTVESRVLVLLALVGGRDIVNGGLGGSAGLKPNGRGVLHSLLEGVGGKGP